MLEFILLQQIDTRGNWYKHTDNKYIAFNGAMIGTLILK